MRRLQFAALLAAALSGVLSERVEAAGLNALNRCLGIGCGEGYHARTCCPPKNCKACRSDYPIDGVPVGAMGPAPWGEPSPAVETYFAPQQSVLMQPPSGL